MPKQQLKSAKTLRPLSEGSSIYTGQLSEDTPSRLYKVRVNRASSLNVALTDLRSNADLALLNRKGKVLNQSANKGRIDETINHAVERGVYYIRVAGRKSQTQYRLSLGLGTAKSAPPPQLKNAAQLVENPIVKQVVAITNAYRQQAGLKPLRLNAQLTASAQAHTEDMALNDFFSHSGSNRSTIFDRAEQVNYNYSLVAENIAAGYTTPTAVVKAWMDSPGHRANMMYPDLQEIGVGVYFLANDTGTTNYQYYWTQDFGVPA